MKRSVILTWGAVLALAAGLVYAADIVPNEIQQPGTQPQEISNLESPDKYDNCHGGYNELVEPAYNWRGSMMANAGRDPIFWATLAVAEQDFDGAGDLCIRCHSTAGWLAGRSTPTDGSGLAAGDADGVECDFCHKMTNPDNSEHLGVMNPPFIANDNGDPGPPTTFPYVGNGYYGSGMASIWGGSEKLGPYAVTVARHQDLQSSFHRSQDFCGTCHDVSNPAVGDLAPNNGTQDGYPLTVDADGGLDPLGDPTNLANNAAFNNLPFQYGIVERTFSEYKAGALSGLSVSLADPNSSTSLPDELKAGAILVAYESSIVAGTGGDYEDGTPRTFTCQTCHVRPVEGAGCNKKGAPIRKDLPLHDMTGGNYWMPEAIKYLDTQAKLRLGGGLTAVQIAALDAGAVRAKKQLNEAVALSVTGNTLRVVNLTGHKLISGYPEGRRMWLNIKWYDAGDVLLREDGAYGSILVSDPANPGTTIQVESLLDPYDPNTKVYEAHYGMTQEWAAKLVGLGYDPGLALSYNRYTGEPDFTLGDLKGASPGTYHETFHFVLNNTVVKDNRIPPYGFSYDEARDRNALPVPATQYSCDPLPCSTYDYFDLFTLDPPTVVDGYSADATYATIEMKYQPTSWEYIQFLRLANNGLNPFLADEGVFLLEAWLNTTMAAPYVMASTTWGNAPVPATPKMHTQNLNTFRAGKRGQVIQTDIFKTQDNLLLEAEVVDEFGAALTGAQVFVEVADSGGNPVVSLEGFSDDIGTAQLQWRIPRQQAPDLYTAKVTGIIKNGYEFQSGIGQDSVSFTVQ
jgi:hypothetical protein